MRERRVHQEVQRREARRAIGLSPYGSKFRPQAVLRAPYDAEHLALPQALDDLEPMQDQATGSFFFMLDYSALDGPDGFL